MDDKNSKSSRPPSDKLQSESLNTLDKRIEHLEEQIGKIATLVSLNNQASYEHTKAVKEIMASSKATMNYMISSSRQPPATNTTPPATQTPTTNPTSYATSQPTQPTTTPTPHLQATAQPTPKPVQPASQTAPPTTTTKQQNQTLPPPPHSSTTSHNPTSPPPDNTQHPHNPSSHKRMKLKTLLLCDSQMNTFSSKDFSSTFDTTRSKVGSYTDFMTHHTRKTLATPGVDAYILQLGINDLRHLKESDTRGFQKAVEAAKASISLLILSSSAKVAVCLPTATPSLQTLNRLVTKFNELINSHISQLRTNKTCNSQLRLFTINNNNFRNYERDGKPNPLAGDGLHVNDYGIKKLCLNIKLGLQRAFGFANSVHRSHQN